MRPVPIPDNAVWAGGQRVVMAAPDGDLTNSTIAPVEVVVDQVESTGGLCYSARCALEPGDLEKLQAGDHVWVSFYGGVMPFSVDVGP
jgi:hypothetical protein